MTSRDLGFVAIRLMGLYYLVNAFYGLVGMLSFMNAASDEWLSPRSLVVSNFAFEGGDLLGPRVLIHDGLPCLPLPREDIPLVVVPDDQNHDPHNQDQRERYQPYESES